MVGEQHVGDLGALSVHALGAMVLFEESTSTPLPPG